MLFKGNGVSSLQDEKSSGDWLHNNVTVLNIIQRSILRWQIFCYVYCTTIKNKT